VWRDWVLVAVVVLWSAVEAMFREDVAWRPVALTVVVVIALTLLWRRTILWPRYRSRSER
jgi:membrane protein DedA with SNARE-associated domain